jgi:hypothetical protein
MAKTNEQFDQHFREKLDGHREKPSALAWERLESQLPKQSKPKFGIWWAIAASVTALLVAGYSFWPGKIGKSEEILLAEKTEMQIEAPTENTIESTVEDFPTSTENNPKTGETEVTPETESTQNQPKVAPKTTEKTKPTPSPALTQAPKNLVAQAETEPIKTPITVAIPELKTEELPVILPELKTPAIEKMVAEVPTQREEKPLYRVSIFSDGVKKSEPQDKNLITELGKTVSQVEGLIGKVDEGLISLQDKKDNLFASMTTRKNQADENP